MALTPEDVVNKRFQPTKFREGYDQDEVDDFLDEVVVELRRLGQENEELRQRLIASDSRINELQRSAGNQAAKVEQPQFAAPPVVAPVAAAPAPYVAPVVEANAVDPSNTNNLLQLARKLHEEHVREGIEKRDALIAEGHATAARVVSEAEAAQQAKTAEAEAAAQAKLAELEAEQQAKAAELEAAQQAKLAEGEAALQAKLAEAEAAQKAKLDEAEAAAQAKLAEAESAQQAKIATLDQERASLEGRVDELRNFERDYRQKLKSYIQGQLNELDSPASGESASEVSNFATPQPAGYQGFGGN